MTTSYIDANKEPLAQGKVYVLGDMFYLLDQPLPSEPNQPISALNDNGRRELIMPSAFSHMYGLDRMQMRVSLEILRTKVNFLERQLA